MDGENNESLEPNSELSYRQLLKDDYVSDPRSGLGRSWLFNRQTLGYDQQPVPSPVILEIPRQASPMLFGPPRQHPEQQYYGGKAYKSRLPILKGQLQVLNLNAVTKMQKSYSCSYELKILQEEKGCTRREYEPRLLRCPIDRDCKDPLNSA